MSDFPSRGRVFKATKDPELSVVVCEQAIKALAAVRRISTEELQTTINGDRASEVSAKEAMAVIAQVEDALGCGPLVSPRDLSTPVTAGNGGVSSLGCMDPAEDTTVHGLVGLIARRLSGKRLSGP